MNILVFEVIKRISIVVSALADNLTGPTVIIMSYYLTKEKPNRMDLMFSAGLFLGVTLMLLGFINDEEKSGWLALAWMILCPLCNSYSQILTKRMQDMNPEALPLYLNMGQVVINLLYISMKGELMLTYELYTTKFDFVDVLLLFVQNLCSVTFQTLRLMAMKHGEPGKLSQWMNLNQVYALIYDVLFFGATF